MSPSCLEIPLHIKSLEDTDSFTVLQKGVEDSLVKLSTSGPHTNFKIVFLKFLKYCSEYSKVIFFYVGNVGKPQENRKT